MDNLQNEGDDVLSTFFSLITDSLAATELMVLAL